MKPALVTGDDWDRAYAHPGTGETVPSVTTILKIIHKPELDAWKPRAAGRYARDNWEELSRLPLAWRAEEIAGTADRIAAERAAVGTVVHELCEKLGKGQNPGEIPKEAKSYLEQFAEFMFDRSPGFIETETTVWSREHDYAGTFDALLEMGGKIVLVDYKSSRRLYPEYGLQLAALANADFILREDGTEQELSVIDELMLLHLRPRSWKLVPVRHERECFTTFLAARELFGWVRELAQDVLGEAA